MGYYSVISVFARPPPLNLLLPDHLSRFFVSCWSNSGVNFVACVVVGYGLKNGEEKNPSFPILLFCFPSRLSGAEVRRGLF